MALSGLTPNVPAMLKGRNNSLLFLLYILLYNEGSEFYRLFIKFHGILIFLLLN